ncbi:unnamed protein product [Adineta ricciae]|uniref:DDE-1 domain-containing protein n=1 Tax=Adineta ricciae TaxID=249248 RepID=A0A815MVI3_ADIRI|nr:unnamed protein product [Adineta ricciae]
MATYINTRIFQSIIHSDPQQLLITTSLPSTTNTFHLIFTFKQAIQFKIDYGSYISHPHPHPQDNSRAGPVLLFKRKGHVSSFEKSQYAQGVTVYFTPKGVINGATMKRYLDFWYSKVKDNHPKLLTTDSCTSHLGNHLINVLDVSIFSVFKNNYNNIVEDYIEKHGPRSHIKLTASQARVLCTNLTWAAWERTLANVDIAKAFRDIG